MPYWINIHLLYLISYLSPYVVVLDNEPLSAGIVTFYSCLLLQFNGVTPAPSGLLSNITTPYVLTYATISGTLMWFTVSRNQIFTFWDKLLEVAMLLYVNKWLIFSLCILFSTFQCDAISKCVHGVKHIAHEKGRHFASGDFKWIQNISLKFMIKISMKFVHKASTNSKLDLLLASLGAK